MINMGPLTPALSVEEIVRIGYSIAIFPAVCISAAMLSIQDALKRFKETGSSPIAHPDQIMQVFATFNKFMGVPYYNELEEKYRSGE